jgi:hypothetical protein
MGHGLLVAGLPKRFPLVPIAGWRVPARTSIIRELLTGSASEADSAEWAKALRSLRRALRARSTPVSIKPRRLASTTLAPMEPRGDPAETGYLYDLGA